MLCKYNTVYVLSDQYFSLSQTLGAPISPHEPLDSSLIEWIRMGTTVATNALLERKGERMALLITKGLKDLLHIGNQSRPQIFDLVSFKIGMNSFRVHCSTPFFLFLCLQVA